MRTIAALSIILFLLLPFYAASQSITKMITLPGVETYEVIDILPNDTIIDTKNGYLAYSDTAKKPAHIVYEAKLFDAAGTVHLFAVTEWSQDMNCDNYNTCFYTYDNEKDSVKKIDQEKIVPGLPYSLFLPDEARVRNTIEKYLPAYNSSRSADPYTVEDVMKEIYEYRFVMPHTGYSMQVKLHVCEYSDAEAVDISQEDWRIVKDTQTITLSFDRKKKVFVVKK